jgi:fructosamine-3-kinase
MQDTELKQKQAMFDAEQANIDKRQLIANQAEMDKLGLQIKANRDTIPTSFAANMSNTVMTGVQAIMADGNMNADAKKAAIANLTTYANAQIAWAEKFYGTAIPQISAPA